MTTKQQPAVRYAVRKFSGRHDYITRWGVVRITLAGTRRVKFSETSDREEAEEQAAELTAALAARQ